MAVSKRRNDVDEENEEIDLMIASKGSERDDAYGTAIVLKDIIHIRVRHHNNRLNKENKKLLEMNTYNC